MKTKIFPLAIICCFLVACNQQKQENKNNSEQISTPVFQNKGHELVYHMVQKVGDYNKLASKMGVEYTYTYQTPDGKTDVSKEKYLFDGELSYGKYATHQRTFPQLEGVIEQGYDGTEYWLKHNGEVLNDSNLLKRVAFNRPTNFYWFCMMQKLLDPGLNYEYLGDADINGENYNLVKVTFNSENGKPTDIYQLYINSQTLLVDQFLFTVADFGKMEVPNLMQLEYEQIDGLLIPTQRRYKPSTWNADVSENPWVKVTWSDINFNSKITPADFKK